MILKNLRSISLLFFFLSASLLCAQEVDISGALKSIESGKLSEAETIFQRLKEVNPSNPDVIFLDALLTKDGEESLRKYSQVFEKHPKSKYADVSLFRIFSYYYSLGLYKRAESFYNRLKIDYPASPYIAAADRKIPNIEEPVNKIETSEIDTSKKILLKETDTAKLTIQAGAFLNAENAAKLKELLTADGYFTEIVNRVVGGSLLKVVYAGKFASEAEAKTALNYIETKHKLKGRVITIPPKP